MAIGNHVSLRSLCSLLYPVCVSELCGSGWEPGQLLRACLPQSRENSLSVKGTTNQCSWPCSSCGQATFDLDIGWESWNVVEALCSRAGMFTCCLGSSDLLWKLSRGQKMGLCYLLAVKKMDGRSSVPEALGKEALWCVGRSRLV